MLTQQTRHWRYPGSSLRSILLIYLAYVSPSNAYVPHSRWGQAHTTTSGNLIVHGGKVDPQKKYSYYTAPNTDELISLDLTSSFMVASPPWKLLAGGDLSNSPIGSPSIAFHTLTTLDDQNFLGFGGDGGSSIPNATDTDSAWLLTNPSFPKFQREYQGWANEPVRRIHHTSTSVCGTAWIIGGMKSDGSQVAFNSTYQFIPSTASSPHATFNELGDRSPGLEGHGSALLSNGTILVLGGYAPGQHRMLPLNTVWTADTNRTTHPPDVSPSQLSWSSRSFFSPYIPPPRHDFAYALLDNEKLLIHGGASDPLTQSILDDAAVLDLKSLTWTNASGLVNLLGRRAGHFAVSLNNGRALIGFGYGPNGPVSPNLVLYDIKSDSSIPIFTPGPAPTRTRTNLPWPSTSKSTSGSSTSVASQSVTSRGVSSSTSIGGSLSSSTQRTGGGPSTGYGAGQAAHDKKMIAITLGSVFGLAVLVAASLGGTRVYLRQRREDEWRNDESGRQLIRNNEHPPYPDEEDGDRLGGYSPRAGASGIVATDIGRTGGQLDGGRRDEPGVEGEEDSPTSGRDRPQHLPMASISGGWGQPSPRKSIALVFGLGRQGTSHANDRNCQRFDMLADEDEREFEDLGAYDVSVRRNGSGRSGVSDGRPDPRSASGRTWTSVVGQSITGSIKSAGAAVQRAVSGTAGPSATGQHSPDWWEKDMEFIDTQAKLLDENGGPSSGRAADEHVGPSYPPEMLEHSQDGVSTLAIRSDVSRYRDPYSDPIEKDPIPAPGRYSPVLPRDEADESAARNAPPRLVTKRSAPQIDVDIPLSPIISRSDQSHTDSSSSYPPSSGASRLPRSSDTHSGGSSARQPLKRSDSWWARFSRTTFRAAPIEPGSKSPSTRSRRLSFSRLSGGNPSAMDKRFSIDFRDPNPPPVLQAIEETGKSPDASPVGDASGNNDEQHRRRASMLNSTAPTSFNPKHSSSVSSQDTASSAVLEHVGGNMHIIQRVQTTSTAHTPTPSEVASLSSQRAWIVGTVTDVGEFVTSPVESPPAHQERPRGMIGPRPKPQSSSRVVSPLIIPVAGMADRPPEQQRVTPVNSPVDTASGGPRLPPVPAKAAAERHRAADVTPTNVKWGLGEKPALFLANPDERKNNVDR